MVGYHIGFDLVLQHWGDMGDDLDKVALIARFEDAANAVKLGEEGGEVIGEKEFDAEPPRFDLVLHFAVELVDAFAGLSGNGDGVGVFFKAMLDERAVIYAIDFIEDETRRRCRRRRRPGHDQGGRRRPR